MDYLKPEELNENHKSFIIERLALNPHNLIEAQETASKFFGKQIPGEVVQKINSECQEDIKKKRESLYIDGLASLPLANAFPIIAICQSRVEDLLKNPKIMRTIRRLHESGPMEGREYMEEVKEIDDKTIQNYLTICQNERFNSIKLEIAKIVNAIDKKRLPQTSFRPVEINTGFVDDSEEAQANS